MTTAARNPISRIDTDDTHGHFARVYRVGWSRGRMFSDGVYGGADKARSAALAWHKRVDAVLPIIPRKPVLKVAKYSIHRGKRGRCYLVYLPLPGKGKPKSVELYFNDITKMDEQAERACKLVKIRNSQLELAYRLELAAWKRERDRIMREIARIWEKVK